MQYPLFNRSLRSKRKGEGEGGEGREKWKRGTDFISIKYGVSNLEPVKWNYDV